MGKKDDRIEAVNRGMGEKASWLNEYTVSHVLCLCNRMEFAKKLSCSAADGLAPVSTGKAKEDQ